MAKSAEAFRTISEVAEWLDTPAHVLRFWESKFPQVKPVKRAGGRRYYRPTDMELLGGIKQLLHNDGMTIKGVQKLLREQGVKHVAGFSQGLNLDLDAQDEHDEATAGFIDAEPEAEPKGRLLNFPSADAAKGDAADDEAVPPAPDAARTDAAPSGTTAAMQSTPKPETAPPAPDSTQKTPAQSDAPPDLPFEETDDLPDFLRKDASADQAPGPDTGVDAPSKPAAAPPQPEATPEPKPQAARARQVDTPDDPGDDMPAEPGLLARLAHVRGPIAPAKAAELAALLSRLTALRSQMADGRKE